MFLKQWFPSFQDLKKHLLNHKFILYPYRKKKIGISKLLKGLEGEADYISNM